MKLKTVTGKESFYQWDTDQSLETEGVEENQEVHFCRKQDTVALVCRVRQENGKRIVDVPNELLQTSEMIIVYVYARDEWGNRTCHAQSFAVLPGKACGLCVHPDRGAVLSAVRCAYEGFGRRGDFQSGDGLSAEES